MKIKFIYLLLGATLLWSCGGKNHDSSSNEEYTIHSSIDDESEDDEIEYTSNYQDNNEETSPSYEENDEVMPEMPSMPGMEEFNDSSEDEVVDKNELKKEAEEILKEYKKLVQEAIALSKKAKAGDENASLELIQKSGECTTIAAKIMDIANKIDDPNLVVKYQKINMEYINGLK